MASNLLSSICSLVAKLTGSIHRSQTPSSSSSGPSRIEEDLKKVERTLQRIQAVLIDAEEREIRDESVKLWLKEIKGVAYDAEDVLDEYQYELIRAQVERAARTSRKRKRKKKVRDLTSTLLNLSIPEKIRNIRERFDEISKDREALQLREGEGTTRPDISMNPQPTSSHVDESGIFGREEDRDKLIEMILSDKSCRFSVIPIIGMGGLGKTTVAQLVYNDIRVQQYFDSMGWVCVSENFDVRRLTNEVIESISRQPCNLKQLNALQDTLKEEVKGKKLLLVLDDVWNEQQGPWDSFRAPFGGAQIVRIIITTRNESVAEIMQTVPPYRLDYLSYDQCWSLFQHCAFGGQEPNEYPHLVDISSKIIEKCGRLPLSVKIIGGLLHYELDEVRWMDILESDLWSLDQARKDIIPALKFSYLHLPAHLKSCFLYSSLFPKDYRFTKDRLVKLWMAQGFILTSGNNRLEDIGSKYFDELHRRSLFQSIDSSGYYRSDDNAYFFLHDAIHDLARSISDNEYCAITLKDDKEQHNISKEVRHLFIKCERGASVDCLSFDNPRVLRTLIVEMSLYMMADDFVDLDGLDCLRAVELRGKYFLNSIGNLKHLRHLNVQGCNNKDVVLLSLCHHYNLQSFEMTFYDMSDYLIEISNLVNLRLLIMSGPQGNFRVLINVDDNRVGKFLHRCLPSAGTDLAKFLPHNNITEINMHGFRIWKCFPPLSNFEEHGLSDGIFPGLRKLNIESNYGLKRLQFLPLLLQSIWIQDCPNFTTFQCLQDCTTLKELHLSHCPQLQLLPGDDHLPPKLQKVHIRNCMNVTYVPGLQNLSSLKELYLEHCFQLQLGQESLPSKLQNVHITECRKLKAVAGLQNLTSLKSLELKRCPLLEIIPDECLPCRPHHVEITDCPRLREWCIRHQLHYTQDISVLVELTSDALESTDEIEVNKFSIHKKLHLQLFWESSLPSNGLHNLYSLEELVIMKCPKLQCCSTEHLPPQLRNLTVENCRELATIVGLQSLKSLEVLVIRNCPVQFAPNEHLPSSLHSLTVTDCKNLQFFPLIDSHELQFGQDKSLQLMLQNVHISSCGKLKEVTGLQYLTSLKSLELKKCPLLQIIPDERLLSRPQHVEVTDCPRLREWCKRHQFHYSQDISVLEELTKDVIEFTYEIGVNKFSFIKKLHLHLFLESSLPSHSLHNLYSLEELIITECPKLQSCPIKYLPSELRRLTIENCMELTSVVGLQSLNSLEVLVMRNCPVQKFSQNKHLPSSLHSLTVTDCKSLRSLPLLHCHNSQLGQEKPHQSKLQNVHVSGCWKLIVLAGMQNLKLLKSLELKRCPFLEIRPDECLPCRPTHVEIIDCPKLREWCEGHQFECTLDTSVREELTINCTSKITHEIGVDNLSSLKKLSLYDLNESYLPSDEWLPSTLETLKVCSSKILEIFCLHQKLSSLRKLIIKKCMKVTSVDGLHNLSFLEELVIMNCPELQFSPFDHLPSSLHSLTVAHCRNLWSLPLMNCHNMHLWQDKSPPSKLENVSIINCSKLIALPGLQKLTSLKRLELRKCPILEIISDEFLSCVPQHVEIIDCPRMRKWCKRYQVGCIMAISLPEELTISSTSEIIHRIGFRNLSSIKSMFLCDSQDPYLSSDPWLPSTLQTLEVRSSKILVSLQLQPNLSLLWKLRIMNCSKLTNVVGLQNLNSLEELVITNCPELLFSQSDLLPSSLHTLRVTDCKSLRFLPQLHHSMSAFQMLKLSNCSRHANLCGPSDVGDCPEYVPSLDKPLRLSCLSSNLQNVHISHCGKLSALAGLQYLISLKRLEIKRCPRLQINPDEFLPCRPQHVGITDCPRLRGWCKKHQLCYTQDISVLRGINYLLYLQGHLSDWDDQPILS